jgi:hypothetical protein
MYSSAFALGTPLPEAKDHVWIAAGPGMRRHVSLPDHQPQNIRRRSTHRDPYAEFLLPWVTEYAFTPYIYCCQQHRESRKHADELSDEPRLGYRTRNDIVHAENSRNGKCAVYLGNFFADAASGCELASERTNNVAESHGTCAIGRYALWRVQRFYRKRGELR